MINTFYYWVTQKVIKYPLCKVWTYHGFIKSLDFGIHAHWGKQANCSVFKYYGSITFGLICWRYIINFECGYKYKGTYKVSISNGAISTHE